MSLIDKIANTIRTVDGSNTMGAGELAEHISAALPGMVQPLIWDQTDGVLTGQKIWSYGSNQTQWIVQNGENGDFVLCESLTIDFAPCSPVTGVYKTLEDAKAAANTHHRAYIMAAFGLAKAKELTK